MAEATIHVGDCRSVLKALPDESIHCVVTSPPYFGLRDYGADGQIGLEQTPDEYVQEIVQVFREVRRVLRSDGTLWLNLGDSYAGSWGAQSRGNVTGERSSTLQGGSMLSARQITSAPHFENGTGSLKNTPGLKPKDLIGIPWRVAFALQADGYYLRQDIIWHKPNAMPESVTDRCTKAHEYIFLLSKSERYYYDHESVKEDAVGDHLPGNNTHRGDAAYEEGHIHHRTKSGLVAYAQRQRGKGGRNAFRGQGHFRVGDNGPANRNGREMRYVGAGETRNRRSVWTVATRPFSEAHFATFPPALIEPCILAGCPKGGMVLDPFNGAGTTGLVALKHGRNYIGIEINEKYANMSRARLAIDAPLFDRIQVVI